MPTATRARAQSRLRRSNGTFAPEPVPNPVAEYVAFPDQPTDPTTGEAVVPPPSPPAEPIEEWLASRTGMSSWSVTFSNQEQRLVPGVTPMPPPPMPVERPSPPPPPIGAVPADISADAVRREARAQRGSRTNTHRPGLHDVVETLPRPGYPSPPTPVTQDERDNPPALPTGPCVHGINGPHYWGQAFNRSSSSFTARHPNSQEHMSACSTCRAEYNRNGRDASYLGLITTLHQEERRLRRPLTTEEATGIIRFFRYIHGAPCREGDVFNHTHPGGLFAWVGAAQAARRRQEQQYEREQQRLRRRHEREDRERNRNRGNDGTFGAPAEPLEIPDMSLPLTLTEEERIARGLLRCGCYPSDGCDCSPRRMNRSAEHGKPFLEKATMGRNARLVGVEVEFNTRVRLDKWLHKWRGAMHSDGSCGWEAVTTPMAGNHIDACMRDLMRGLRAEDAEADDRCGVHVHVDARDIRWADMLRLLRVYTKLEPIMYLLAGQHRIGQHYCAPCGSGYKTALANPDPKEGVIKYALGVVSGRKRMRQCPDKKDGGRYKGLNIIPWLAGRRLLAPDTTVEFRMHRNSLDAGRVANWAKLCCKLVEWCSLASDADAEKLPKSALRALCTVIAPELAPWILKRVAEWRRATTPGRKLAYDVAGGTRAQRRISMKGGVYSCAA